MAAHDLLRDAIRTASLATWDRCIAEESEGFDADTRAEVERGFLVDYAVVAVFDSGNDDHTVQSVLRTDGKCSAYRIVGLLTQALDDL